MKKLNHTMRRILIVGGILVAISGTALAASTITTKMIEAQYSGIKLVVDSIEVTPTDATGKVIEPFAFEGTTYLPVRAVADALGKPVEWDGNTQTIYIGDIPGKEINWMTKLPPYQTGVATVYSGNTTDYFTVSGEKHGTGIVVQESGGWMSTGPKTAYALWNTDGKYKSATMTIGHIDGEVETNTAFHLYVDEKLIDSYEVTWDGAPKTFTFPLNYGQVVKLMTDKGTFAYGIYDISFAE